MLLVGLTRKFFRFVENYNVFPVTVRNNREMLDLETGATVKGDIELDKYGVRVFLVKK